jgi:small-conductance mechanosensitive channel
MNHFSLRRLTLLVLVVFALAVGAQAADDSAKAITTAVLELEAGIPAAGDSTFASKLGAVLSRMPPSDLEMEAIGPGGWLEKTRERGRLLGRAYMGEPGAGEASTLKTEQEALAHWLGVVLAAWQSSVGEDADALAVIAKHRAYVDKILPGKSLAPDVGFEDLKDPSALGNKLLEWVKSPEGGIAIGLKILAFFGILIVFKILAAIVGGIVRRAVGRMKSASQLLRDFFVNAIRKLTFFIGLIVALDVIGINAGPFVAALGAVGFIVGFALQGTLSNFAAGIMILIYRPFDIGDFVEVAGVLGKVQAMTLVSTTIKTPDNQVVIVPNNSIWGGIITNVTGARRRRVDMVFGIGYEDDIVLAKTVLEGILSDHELVLDDPAPMVQLHELADSSVNFVCRPWTETANYWSVFWDVTQAVKVRFDEAGLSIPYPQQDVHMHQVAAPADAD